MQRRQQALLVAEGQLLAPQRVVLVQQADLGVGAVLAVEHLDAVGPAQGQDQRQVLVFQGVAIQLQRAVVRQVAAQVIHQGWQVRQAGMANLARLQLQDVETLLDLQQEARHAGATEQLLRVVEQFLHPLADGLGTIAAEAAHPQARLGAIGGQAVEVVAQAVEQGVGPLEAAYQQFVPAVQGHLVDGQHQVVAHPGIAEGVGALAGQVEILLAVLLQRVDADVDQQQHLGRHPGAQQGAFIHLAQGQGEGLLQAGQQVGQLELGQVAAARMQGEAGAAVDHPVAMAPGEQGDQLAAALEGREVLPFQGIQAAGEERPLGFAPGLRAGALHQGEGVFGDVRGYSRVDELYFARLALECGVEASAEYAQVAAAERAAGLLAAGELGEEAVAVGQLVDQGTAFGQHLAHLPLAAAVEHRQLALLPVPVGGQALQQQALPALVAIARRPAELLVDLEVEAAADQLQALRFAAAEQILFEAAVDHHVRVQLVEVEAVGVDRFLEAQRQAGHLRVLAGVDLGEEQLEHRLVGRLDALEQLPHAGADEFAGRDVRQVAEVEHLLGADETFGQQGTGVLDIARLLVHRHQPPERGAPGEPDGGAVELVEQQVVLGGAAVVGGQARFAIAPGEAGGVDQEEVRLGALAGGPFLERAALALQLGDGGGVQFRRMADPDVHVALLGLGDGAQATHQEQAVDRLRLRAAARLVGEGAGQALGLGQQFLVRFEGGDPGGRGAGDVTGQQWVVDVEEQRQQLEDQLLARRKRLHGAGQAAVVDLEEACAQLREDLAVDAVVDVRADFLGARHALFLSRCRCPAGSCHCRPGLRIVSPAALPT
ncbi:hypothetical protein FQZ97_570510 [compost metagenome]